MGLSVLKAKGFSSTLGTRRDMRETVTLRVTSGISIGVLWDFLLQDPKVLATGPQAEEC